MRTSLWTVHQSPICTEVLRIIPFGRIWSVVLSLVILSIFTLMTLTSVNAQQAGTDTPEQLVEKMKQGGYILYIRHAATDHSQADKDLTDLSKCELQRNLSAQGKEETKIMAMALAKLEIKVEKVITSPYCRCVDTAKIAFDRYDIVEDMRATFYTNEAETTHLGDYLKSELTKKPKAGFNTVLVGHTANLRDVTQVWPKPEGVVHVFKPLGEGGYEHLGRITPVEWAPLAGIN